MSFAARCSFCVKLPATANRHAGRAGKCPLCRGELVIAPGSGCTYRLLDAEETAGPSRRGNGRRLLYAGFGVGLVVGGLLAARALLNPAKPSAAVSLAQAAAVVPEAPRPGRTSPWDEEVKIPERLLPPAPDQGIVRVRPQAAVTAPFRPAAAAREKLPPPVPSGGISAPPVLTRSADLPLPMRYRDQFAREEDLRIQLALVPEVGLEPADGPARPRQAAKEHLEKQAKAIHEQTTKDSDAFVKRLESTRADLAGLPFLKGQECRLSGEQAKHWSLLSRKIRRTLASLARSFRSSSPSTSARPGPNPYEFWSAVVSPRSKVLLQEGATIAALQQLLQAEHLTLRLFFVHHLEKITSATASSALARRAVFDLHPEVRAGALAALKGRPAADYSPVLLEALRHPWPPAAERAAEAIATLKLKDVVPQLIELLDQPDPDAPFLATVKGKPTPVVRELVRVNHFRNCLLCHAPSFNTKDMVRGLVPVPGEKIPVAYYAERSRGLFVRADVTYLRQDFSVMLPVADSKPWPESQRYDFLVRTRPLTEKEQAAWIARAASAERGTLSDYKLAILKTLHELTGEFAGTTAAQWREVLRVIEEVRSEPRDPAQRIGCKRPCVR